MLIPNGSAQVNIDAAWAETSNTRNCKTGGWHLKIAISQKNIGNSECFSIHSVHGFLRAFSALQFSWCPVTWIVIPQYCQQVTWKPSSYFHNKNLARITRVKICYNSLNSFTKSSTWSTNHVSLPWSTTGMQKVTVVGALSIS